MYSANQITLLFAKTTDVSRVWGRFGNERAAYGFDPIMVFGGVLVLTIAVMLIWRRATGRQSRDYSSDSQIGLFKELCRAHGLKSSRRRLLKQLAMARGLPSPAVLFVEPRHFDEASLPESLKVSAIQLLELRRQLFE